MQQGKPQARQKPFVKKTIHNLTLPKDSFWSREGRKTAFLRLVRGFG